MGRDHDLLEGSETGRLSHRLQIPNLKTPSWARLGTQRTWLIKAGAGRDHKQSPKPRTAATTKHQGSADLPEKAVCVHPSGFSWLLPL